MARKAPATVSPPLPPRKIDAKLEVAYCKWNVGEMHGGSMCGILKRRYFDFEFKLCGGEPPSRKELIFWRANELWNPDLHGDYRFLTWSGCGGPQEWHWWSYIVSRHATHLYASYARNWTPDMLMVHAEWVGIYA